MLAPHRSCVRDAGASAASRRPVGSSAARRGLALAASALLALSLALFPGGAANGDDVHSDERITELARLALSRPRRIELRYRAEIDTIDRSAGPVEIFLPLPREGPHQRIEQVSVHAPVEGQVIPESAYGNRVWHGRIGEEVSLPVEVELVTVIERRPVRGGASANAPESREDLARFLGPNQRVVVAHEVLEPILAEIREQTGGGPTLATARAIYDWVIDHLEYKKVGEGWGNGDTFWACSARYGNCTDFHALFISLARTEGIPARFEIGFPVPERGLEGEIGGYHCWVSFHLPELGWFPIDASEAAKHPERRDFFFGTQPADRVHFTTGRDLQLGEAHRGPALNYLVYPYLEQGGAPAEAAISLEFRYRDLTDPLPGT